MSSPSKKQFFPSFHPRQTSNYSPPNYQQQYQHSPPGSYHSPPQGNNYH